MSNKLVALVITNLAGSGAEKVVLNLFDMFNDRGIDAYIFLLEDEINYDISYTQRNKIISLSKNRKYYKLISTLGDKLLSNTLRQELIKIEKTLSKKFDLILSNLPAADRVCQYLDNQRNIYYCIHTSYLQEIQDFKKNGKLKRALKKEKLYKSIYRNKKLVSVSNGIIDDINKLEVNYESIETIYNPFNFELIIKKGEDNLNIDRDNDYIICASAYRNVKRHDILLKAYKKSNIKEKLLLLCKPFDGLINLIKELELDDKVEILGFQKNPYPFIKNAKLLVLSSEREGLPTVLIESLILGTPVVSTNCISGPSEILTGSLSKYLAEVNNVDDLASKIYQAMNEDVIIDEKELEKFSEDNIIKKYLNLIKE